MINGFCVHCMEPVREGDSQCGSCHSNLEYEPKLHHVKPGSLLKDRYLIGRVLGEGGFGITYVGRDVVLDMRVAIKEFYPNGLSHRNHHDGNTVTLSQGNSGKDFEKNMQRFLQEARILAKFANEPGIVGVRDFFRENGTAYIVMEYLDGITLKTFLKANGPVQPDLLFAMLDPVLLSLGRVHEQGLIHRDISPDNIILLRETGSLKLLDFGAARDVTEDKSLSVVLKWGYAPEEQYRTKGVQGAWTDVYAICATMYKCITGITPMESLERVFNDELKLPSELGIPIEPAQEKALMHGMGIKRENRTPNIRVLREELFGTEEENHPPRITVELEYEEDGTHFTVSRNGTGHSAAVESAVSSSVSRIMEGRSSMPEPDGQEDMTAIATLREVAAAVQPEEERTSRVLQEQKTPAAEAIPQEAAVSEEQIPQESAVPEVQISLEFAVPEEQIPQASPVPEEGEQGTSTSGRFPRWLKVLIPSAAAAAAVLAAVLFLGGSRDTAGPAPAVALPTERTMASDCSAVLKQGNASGSVLQLRVQKQKLYDQYQTLITTCDVTVLEQGREKQYTVKLHYDYEDGEWIFHDLSRVLE